MLRTCSQVGEGLPARVQPLGGALLPVQHLGRHVGPGVFACLHLPDDCSPGSVRLWDVNADLGEQPFVALAPAWKDYCASDPDTLDAAACLLERWKAQAAEELQTEIERFRRFADNFHLGYEERHGGQPLDHDRQSELPRLGDWKPVRCCVHDCLMGVMAYRYDEIEGRVEASAWPRGTTPTTRGEPPAICCWCCWANGPGAPGGIAFVAEPGRRGFSPSRIPHEVALLSYLAGCKDVQPGSAISDFAQCEKLFLYLTLGRRVPRGWPSCLTAWRPPAGWC